MTPHVTIHPHGELAAHFGRTQRGVQAPITPGVSIRGLLASLGVPEGEVWVCALNGAVAQPDQPLSPGDVLEIFSPVAGGGSPPVLTL